MPDIQPLHRLKDVYDESDPKHHRTYQTEIANNVIVVRASDQDGAVWSGAWPSSIPTDAPGLSDYAVREINKLLAEVST